MKSRTDIEKIVQEENDFWTEIFKKELSQKKSHDQLFSSYWWEEYYGEITHYVRTMLCRFSDPKILEAGSGSGKSSILLGKNLNRTFLDISPTALEFAKHLIDKFQVENIKCIVGDIFEMPFPENTFDLTWNIGVIEHYEEDDIKNMLYQMMKVTKPGGIIAVGFPNFKSFPIIKASVLKKKIFRFIPGYRLGAEKPYIPEQVMELGLLAAEQVSKPIKNINFEMFGSPLFMETPDIILKFLGHIFNKFASNRRFLFFIVFELE